MKNNAFHEHPLGQMNIPIRCGYHKEPFEFPLHYHQEVEMIFVEKGRVEISVLQKDYEVKEGQLVIIGCNHIHSYKDHRKNEARAYHVLLFDWRHLLKHFDPEVEELLYPLFFDVTVIDTKKIHGLSGVGRIMNTLSLENMNEESASQFIKMGYLLELIGTLLRFGHFNARFDYMSNQMEKEHELLSQVNEYIFSNYQDGISLTSTAKFLGYSEFHFARQFKKYTGVTFKQYLMHYQISMAKEDVVDGDLTIVQVADKHGFNSVKTFNRVFKTYYGVAPTVYRKENNDQDDDA